MVHMTSPPPTGYQPQRFSSASTRKPIMHKAGRYAFAKSSNGGDHSTCVPPRTTTVEAASASASGTARVCRRRVTEPALPRSAVSATSTMYAPDVGGWLGANLSSVEPSRSPDTAAPLMAAAARTADRCWGKRPALRRPARMLTRRNARAAIVDRLSAVRSIWPPPSPKDPSRTRTSVKSEFQLHC